MPRFASAPALAGLVMVFVAQVQAQDGPGSSSFPTLGNGAPAKAAQEDAATPVPAAKPVEAAPAAEAQLFEATEELGLRNIPNAELPAINAEPLPKGTLVWMLRRDEAAGFSRVSVLGGIEGWVHASYVKPLGDGFAEVTGDKVAFRSEPDKSGWPVDRMRKGTVLRLLDKDEKGEWYRVLGSPAVGALVETAKLALVGGVPIKAGGELAGFDEGSDLAKRAAAQQATRLAAWEAQRERFRSEAEMNAALAALEREIADVEGSLDVEERRGDLAGLELAGAQKLAAGFHGKVEELAVTEGPVVDRLAALDQRLDKLALIRDAAIKQQELARTLQPHPAEAAAARHPDTALPRFEQSGWLRYRPGNYSSFQLVKGGQILCYVTCAKARYKLEDYVGCQLGLQGGTGFPDGADFKVVDVSKLFVLSSR
ncbi:MAG: hypothetical protein R3F30_01700 [Planctomycetota bacterium]